MRNEKDDETVTDEELEAADRLHADMPRRLEDCPGDDEQCPFVACRYHLWTDIESRNVRYGKKGGQREYRRDLVPTDAWGSWATCALRAARQGPRTLDEVGDLLGVTRERVRQIQVAAIAHLAEVVVRQGLCDPDEIESGIDWDQLFGQVGEWSI